MPTDDAAELKRLCEEMLALAERVTPGEWRYSNGQLPRIIAGRLTIAGVHKLGKYTRRNVGEEQANGELLAAARTALPTLARALLSRLEEEAWRDISTAPKVDGLDILVLHQETWAKEPRSRIVRWNDGINKAGYTWPCWLCSVCTLSMDEGGLLAWMPLPEIPADMRRVLPAPPERRHG